MSLNTKQPVSIDLIPQYVIDLWTNTDLSHWLTQYAPQNLGFKYRSREHPIRVEITQKTTLVQYPIASRPVHTKVAFEEDRTIAGRLGSIRLYRKMKHTL